MPYFVVMKKELARKFASTDWLVLGILAFGLCFRVIYLSLKPPHFDEGINGWFVDQLISNGFYRYDPTNYHGPLHFYILFISKLFFGRNLFALRIPTVLFGMASVYLTLKFNPYIGKWASRWAALFMTISTGMIFYSRYAIHETELLFFSLLALLGYLRHQTKKDETSIWLVALGLSGMIVTKETFIVHLICFLIATACVKLYEKIQHQKPTPKISKTYSGNDIQLVIAISLLIILTFYSGFFLNGRGFSDSIRSFSYWFSTGQGANGGVGHEKPFYYWFDLMKQYEWTSLLGFILCLRLVWPVDKNVRLIGVFGVGVLIAYSIVPYKTPWCIINLIWPFMIVVGYVFSEILSLKKKRSLKFLVIISIAGLCGLDVARAIKLNFYHFDDEIEPYVYVQTFRDILPLSEKIHREALVNTGIPFMPFNILMESSWPLPWLFGDFWQGNYAGRPVPQNPDAAFIFADGTVRSELEKRLKHSYFKTVFRLRSAQGEAIAYFDSQLFKSQFEPGTAVFTPEAPKPLRADQGLTAKFYTNEKWEGEPAHIRHVPEIDFSWEDRERPLPAPFGIVFEGEIMIPQNGPVIFSLTSDDGSILQIDGITIIDNSGAHPQKTIEQFVSETKGWHKVKLLYNDFGGGMMARLMWRNEPGGFETIHQEFFRP